MASWRVLQIIIISLATCTLFCGDCSGEHIIEDPEDTANGICCVLGILCIGNNNNKIQVIQLSEEPIQVIQLSEEPKHMYQRSQVARQAKNHNNTRSKRSQKWWTTLNLDCTMRNWQSVYIHVLTSTRKTSSETRMNLIYSLISWCDR